MDMKNLPNGTKVRTTELVSCGHLVGAITFIPSGTEVTVQKGYDKGQADAAYRVAGATNQGFTSTGIAFHDEIEEL